MMTFMMIMTLMYTMYKNPKPKILCTLLLLFTMMSSLKLSKIYEIKVTAFILFLSLAGGLLIIFFYMTSTYSKNIYKLPISTTMMLIPPLLMLMIMYKSMNYLPTNLSEPTKYLFYNNKFTMFMIMFLFITLYLIIKICLSINSPLKRKIKNET